MSNVTALRTRTGVADEWLSPAEVCEVIPGMTLTLLQRMRDAGKGPRYAKPTPKTVVYSLADVHAYVRSTMVTTREQS